MICEPCADRIRENEVSDAEWKEVRLAKKKKMDEKNANNEARTG